MLQAYTYMTWRGACCQPAKKTMQSTHIWCLICCCVLLLQVFDMARQLLQTCQSQQDTWQGSWPGELAHAAATLAELQPARVRWLWQAGEVSRLCFCYCAC
jgi:hypothetical protein